MAGTKDGKARALAENNDTLAKAYNVSKSSAKDEVTGFFRALLKNRSATIGLVILLVFLLMAILGPVFVNPENLKSDFLNATKGPSLEHLLGTDHLGRDTLALIVYGAREVLLVAFIAAAITLTIATVIGMLAAMTRGILSAMIDVLINIIMTVPSLPVMMLLSTIIDASNPFVFAFVLSVWSWAGLAKAILAQILGLKNREYVEAARILGMPTRHIIIRELLPSISSYLTMNLIFTMRNAISASVTLMFLGMAQFSASHWGMMIQIALSKTGAIYGSSAFWYFLSPVLAITIFGVGCFFFSHGLDEVLNPRLRNR